MIKLQSTKPRSKRLRKKLHVGEFTENYVQINFKIRKSHAAMMDIEAWCDFHDLLFDLMLECGVQPGCGSSSHNKMDISFTQYANTPDATRQVVQKIRDNVDVYLDQIYATPPKDVWNWFGWDYFDEPFDLIEDLAFLVNP